VCCRRRRRLVRPADGRSRDLMDEVTLSKTWTVDARRVRGCRPRSVDARELLTGAPDRGCTAPVS
jgi:hypothetical protein